MFLLHGLQRAIRGRTLDNFKIPLPDSLSRNFLLILNTLFSVISVVWFILFYKYLEHLEVSLKPLIKTFFNCYHFCCFCDHDDDDDDDDCYY